MSEQKALAPMRHVVSVLQELEELGVYCYIGGCENWDSATIARAIEYRRKTGVNPVRERHMIMMARDMDIWIETQDERDMAKTVLAGGCWKISDLVRDRIELALRQADDRESRKLQDRISKLTIENMQLGKVRVSAVTMKRVLRAIGKYSHSTAGTISKEIRMCPVTIMRVLEALESLEFVIAEHREGESPVFTINWGTVDRYEKPAIA